MSDNEKVCINITPITVMEVEKMLDYLVKNEQYMAQIGNLKIKYIGISDDSYENQREMFYIERKK